MDFSEWFGFFAPGGTSAPVMNAQHRPARGARPEGRRRRAGGDGARGDVLDARGSWRSGSRPTYDNWGPIVKKIGFTADS